LKGYSEDRIQHEIEVLNAPVVSSPKTTLVVDDINDTGKTLEFVHKTWGYENFAVLIQKEHSKFKTRYFRDMSDVVVLY